MGLGVQGIAVRRDCGAGRLDENKRRMSEQFGLEHSSRRLARCRIGSRLPPLVKESRQSVARMSRRCVSNQHERTRLEQLQVCSSELACALSLLQLLLAP